MAGSFIVFDDKDRLFFTIATKKEDKRIMLSIFSLPLHPKQGNRAIDIA